MVGTRRGYPERASPSRGWSRARAAPSVPLMPVFARSFEVDAPIEVVRRFHGSSDALYELTPPGVVARLHEGGPMREGLVVRFTMWFGPLPIRWEAHHEDVGPDGFTDVQVRGPHRSWRHRHRFVALGPGRTRVEDRVEYEHPAGLKGVGTRLLFGAPALAVLFRYRAWATRRACEGAPQVEAATAEEAGAAHPLN